MDFKKFSSGKFWLTIISGIVFAYVSFKKIIGAEAIVTIITMVFVSYFQKEKDQPNGGKNV